MKIIGIRVDKKHFVLPEDYMQRAEAIGIVSGPLALTTEDVPDDVQQVWIAHVEEVPPRAQVALFFAALGAPRPCPIQWADPVDADLKEMPNA